MLLTVPNTSHGNVRALSPVLREPPLTVPGRSHALWTLAKPPQRCAQTTLRPIGGAPCSHLLPPNGVPTRTPNRTALAPRCMCDTQSHNSMYRYSLGPSIDGRRRCNSPARSAGSHRVSQHFVLEPGLRWVPESASAPEFFYEKAPFLTPNHPRPRTTVPPLLPNCSQTSPNIRWGRRGPQNAWG